MQDHQVVTLALIVFIGTFFAAACVHARMRREKKRSAERRQQRHQRFYHGGPPVSHEAQIIRIEEQVAAIDAWWLHGSTTSDDEDPGHVARAGTPRVQRPEPVVVARGGGGPQRPQLRLIIPQTTLLPVHLRPATTATPPVPMDRGSPPAYDSHNCGREVGTAAIDVGHVRFAFDRVANWIMGTRAAILATAEDEEAAVAGARKDERRPPMP